MRTFKNSLVALAIADVITQPTLIEEAKALLAIEEKCIKFWLGE